METKTEELDISTVNTMGLSHAISQKQLADLHAQLQKLQSERLDMDREVNLREAHLKAKVAKGRDEKANIEKQLYDTEFVVAER